MRCFIAVLLLARGLHASRCPTTTRYVIYCSKRLCANCLVGYRVKSVDSNLNHQVAELPTNSLLTRYSLPCKFVPQLSVCIVEEPPAPTRGRLSTFVSILPWLIAFFALYMVYVQHTQIQDMHALLVGSGPTQASSLRYAFVGDGGFVCNT